MFDIKNFTTDNIEITNNKGNYYVCYKNKKIQFYLKKCFTITEITHYKGNENILVKIEDEYKDFFKKIENFFIEKYNIDKKNFISLIRTNEKGSIIKLKIMKRYNKNEIEIFNKNNENILKNEIIKNINIKCLIEFDRFWNFNNKYGYIINIKKIYLE